MSCDIKTCDGQKRNDQRPFDCQNKGLFEGIRDGAALILGTGAFHEAQKGHFVNYLATPDVWLFPVS